MKKLMLLPLTSAFFIVVAFTCAKNLETVEKEPPYTDPICESRGELREKVKGPISWSEAVSDWVLWVNVDNPNEPGSGIRYIECVGFPVGYYGSNGASHFGQMMPVIAVQMMPF